MSGPDGTVKVVYIAGSGRSGSTILDRTLGQVDGFFSAGELCNLWGRGLLARRRCGCGVPVPDCPVWGPILGEAFGGVDQIDAERLAAATGRRLRAGSVPRLFLDRRGRQRAAGDGYQAALAHLYRAVVHQTGCRVIVDSSKSPVYARLVAAIPGVEVAVVHQVRDPRATAFSFLRNKRLPDFGDDRLMQRSTHWSAPGAGACGRRRPSCCGGARADATCGCAMRTSSTTRSRPSGASPPWSARPRPRSPSAGPRPCA